MELTGGHVMQAVMLVATIAGGYAVVKNQLARVIQDLAKINDELESVNKNCFVYELNKYFSEFFFETKKIIYIPIKNGI